VQVSKLRGLLFPEVDNESSREEKIRQIKKLVQDDNYISDEKLDEALARLFEEIERE